MTTTPKLRALARLGQIAALGFILFVIDRSGAISVVSQSDTAAQQASDFVDLHHSGDPAFDWISSKLGAVSVDEIDGTELKNLLPENCGNTLICDIVNGQRFGLVLSHPHDQLEDGDIKEARAAALVLLIETDIDKDFDITAKELVYLEQASAGASDDEIAQFLQLSLRAVKERKRKAIEDLGAKNIGHAVGIAKRAKLI